MNIIVIIVISLYTIAFQIIAFRAVISSAYNPLPKFDNNGYEDEAKKIDFVKTRKIT